MSKTATPKSRVIDVRALARVEGEGALYLRLENDQVAEVKLRIYEPPRFYEAFLRGRSYAEVPDLTARICGICPVAYQMSACHAIEMAFGVEVGGQLRALRRLLYCGEWIESHVLHMFLLHLPDFLGCESALALATDHRDLVVGALRLKKAGNELVRAIGGREVHPINACVGGFYRAPTRSDLEPAAEMLIASRAFAVDALRFLAGLEYPDLEMDYDSVALRHPTEVALNEGQVATSRGLEIPISQFTDHFEELHVEHSNALHGRLKGGGGTYLVGPLARLNLNWARYPEPLRDLAREISFTVPCRNQFKSILARGFETLYALDHALGIIRQYERPERARVEIKPRAGVGHGCTEAPRGILYHRYELDADGLVRSANIVPPTAQNQPQIEADLAAFVPRVLHLSQDDLTLRCEQLIRNYDPCISCATHSLKIQVERRPR
jgi:sulfhydrogenase subunit alpha